MFTHAKQLPGYFRVNWNANLLIYKEKSNCQVDWRVRSARPAHPLNCGKTPKEVNYI